jgi:hypothetical protein
MSLRQNSTRSGTPQERFREKATEGAELARIHWRDGIRRVLEVRNPELLE